MAFIWLRYGPKDMLMSSICLLLGIALTNLWLCGVPWGEIR
jgi:hypothetical protein